MNIHEHQAKKILKEYGAVVPEGVFGLTVDDFRPVSPGARGKVQMYKHKGMKKARVLFGKAIQLNKKHVQKIRKEIVLSKLNSEYNVCKWKDALKNTDQNTKKFVTLQEKIERSRANHDGYASRRLEKIKTINNRNERYSFEYERLED